MAVADVNGLEPRTWARIAGLLYLLEGAAAVSGQLLIPDSLLVPGDGAATAANVLASRGLFHASITLGLIAAALHAAQTVVFYELFKPVSRTGARLFAVFSLLAIVMQIVSSLLQLPVLVLLGDGTGIDTLSTEQSQALALASLGVRAQAFNLYLGFFGFRCVVVGYLAHRSTFLPRAIGALMVLSGLAYLTFLYAPLGQALLPFNLAATAPGELAFILWLIVAGVNDTRWKECAAAARGAS